MSGEVTARFRIVVPVAAFPATRPTLVIGRSRRGSMVSQAAPVAGKPSAPTVPSTQASRPIVGEGV